MIDSEIEINSSGALLRGGISVCAAGVKPKTGAIKLEQPNFEHTSPEPDGGWAALASDPSADPETGRELQVSPQLQYTVLHRHGP